MTVSSAQRRGLDRLGYWCSRHGARIVVGWLVVLVLATLAHHASGGSYTDDFSLPGTTSQQGADVLKAHDPTAGGQGGQLVFTTDQGTLADDRTSIEKAAANVRALPHVLAVSDPLSTPTTSQDGRTAYAKVNFDTNPATLGDGYLGSVGKAVQPARAAGVNVDYGGVLGQAARPKANDALSEIIGIAVAILVLLIGFGSVYATGLPILSALLGVITGLGLLGTLAAAITFGTVSPTLAIMMGLGVGIDYGLFLTTRHRQLIMDGVEPHAAAARTVATSGRAVVIAATTVVIAMLGLYASGIGFIGHLGLAGAVAVAVAAVAAITLVPALLGIAGARIDRLAVRAPVAEGTADHATGGWARYAERIGAHPWRYLGAGLAFLALLAIPVLSLRLGHIDAGADPSSYTSNRAYEAIAKGFGPGANGPLTVVAELPQGTSSQSATAIGTQLTTALQQTGDVAAVSPPTLSPDGQVLLTSVVPKTGPQDGATDALLGTLRDTVVPDALHGTGAHGYVTGTTAAQLDFRDVVAARLPIIIGVVVLAAFLLLLVCFRSPFLAVKAALLNLVSIGAAYGVVVAVFQWGWGGSLLGVHEKVPVESYVPMMMFAIVFGLSMDYEVFLLSRIREAWLTSKDNHIAVATGLAATARVISAAAVIMTSVFLAFLLSTNVVVKMLALGLGVSVLVDATVIRLLVVPASMYLLDRANWWIPPWLDRILPHLDPEGHHDAPATDDVAAGPAPQPAPQRETRGSRRTRPRWTRLGRHPATRTQSRDSRPRPLHAAPQPEDAPDQP